MVGVLERIDSKLRTTPSGCREWVGTRSPKGYGKTSYAGKSWTVHRLVWTLVNGPIPEGLVVCHSCDNPPCAEITHLWVGTQADNLRDMREKGRASIFYRHGLPKRDLCSHGHPFSESNTYWIGCRRACRICTRRRQQATLERWRLRRESRAPRC